MQSGDQDQRAIEGRCFTAARRGLLGAIDQREAGVEHIGVAAIARAKVRGEDVDFLRNHLDLVRWAARIEASLDGLQGLEETVLALRGSEPRPERITRRR